LSRFLGRLRVLIWRRRGRMVIGQEMKEAGYEAKKFVV